MKIRNNGSANTALRYTTSRRSALTKSLEKLASGYAINRAGDDAAGLAISEKMRRLITGLNQAHQNSKDGASLIQVGEGALEEIHSMLNRAVTLSEQSANGTYDDALDRRTLQAELDQLCSDIDRIAKSANFNGIKLFQDKGLQFEEPKKISTVSKSMARQALAAAQTAQSAAPRTLTDLLEGKNTGDLNIVYIEQSNASVTATPTGQGSGTLASDKDITITNADGTTTTQKLSDILKTQIVPNTVKKVLDSYPAFSYLTGSTIGIGLEYYTSASNPNAAGALAYITIGYAKTPDLNYANYTLGVNVDQLPAALTRESLEELESTIAHEMIHAFMDEATTAGMIGFDPTNQTFNDAVKFPTWFVEGMAQTASGPGYWVHPYSSGGLRLDENSNAAAIRTQIGNHKLGTNVGGSGDYGTGYLACMYLGWTIASGGNASTPVNAANISRGLTSLMNEVIGGKSLDTAIQELTNNKFASTSAFQTAFNAADGDVTDFVHNLLEATDDGRGGLVSGDLTAKDLIPDDVDTSTKLFELDTEHSAVHNLYPTGYPVLSGGTVSGANDAKPTDFQPAVTQLELGNFIIKGNLPSDGSGGVQGITWDNNTKTLTVETGNDIEISMQSPVVGNGNLVLKGTGKVTLDGVTAASLKAEEDTKVSYKGKNEIDTVTVDSGKNAVFQGEGQLKAGAFVNSGAVNFNGGAVIVGGGTGVIGGTVNVDKASVAANITDPRGAGGSTLEHIAVDWSKLGLADIASISFGGTASAVALSSGDAGKLWLDPSSSHRITFTDSSGVSKTLSAKYENGSFVWAEPIKPFTVTGGTEGTDYHYEDDGTTLVIDTDQVTSISGGAATDEAGAALRGRVKIKDGIGTVNLTLDGVDCSQNTVGSGFDLGTGNNVTLTLEDGKDNKFTGAANFAGISVGNGTNLTINGDTGTLTAAAGKGGTNGAAGIGRNGAPSSSKGTDQTSSITINGGIITATGGDGVQSNLGGSGAGIGAGDHNDFGNITITGGTINATGGRLGGAGIGGANYASCGDITINAASGTAPTITAISNGHGAGIGGGWWDTTNGTITISAGTITAESKTHGTGIGAGCQGGPATATYTSTRGKITINGTAVIKSAIGGDSGAGIGGSSYGTCADVEISGGAVVELAQGGSSGAGIGSGTGSTVGNITIDTTGSVNAQGGRNGVGIGSGYNNSSCGDIEIKQGTITATGSTDSTGIGAGRNSTSGNITIGDAANPSNKVIVTAEGGMTHNGGNIMSYTDKGHNTAGTVTITGNGTSVRPGTVGEGLYSTSGVADGDGNERYAYPVYLFEVDGANSNLDAGVGLNVANKQLLPLDKNTVKMDTIRISSSEGEAWIPGLNHDPLDQDYVFVWLKPENQKLTIAYDEDDGTGNYVSKTVELDLIYHPDAGVFRIAEQPDPPPAQIPGYTPNPVTPVTPPDSPTSPTSPADPQGEGGGIILQIGAEYGETLVVPQFYLSLNALNMGNLDISTQANAWKTMPVVRNAINRVSSIRGTYGALFNRLEHNQRQLQQEAENITDSESRIRDVDVAEEMMVYVKSNILIQSSQAMLAQANQLPQNALQLLN